MTSRPLALAACLLLAGCGLPSFAVPGGSPTPETPAPVTVTVTDTAASAPSPTATGAAVVDPASAPPASSPGASQSAGAGTWPETPDTTPTSPGPGSVPLQHASFGQWRTVGGVQVRVDRPRPLTAAEKQEYGPVGARSALRLEIVNRSGRPFPLTDLTVALTHGMSIVPLDTPPFVVRETDRDPHDRLPDGGRCVFLVGLRTPPNGDYVAAVSMGAGGTVAFSDPAGGAHLRAGSRPDVRDALDHGLRPSATARR